HIGLAGLVDHHRAVAAHERQRRGAVVVHHGLLPAGDQAVHAGTTIVPNPSEVKISSRVECAIRPSTTCAAGTPPRTARRHASILGTMPASSLGSSFSRSLALIWETRLSGSGQSA